MYRPAALGEKEPLGFESHNSAEPGAPPTRLHECFSFAPPAPLRADHWRLCSCFVRPLALGSSHGSLVRSRQTPAGAHALLARSPCAGGRFCAPSAVSAA